MQDFVQQILEKNVEYKIQNQKTKISQQLYRGALSWESRVEASLEGQRLWRNKGQVLQSNDEGLRSGLSFVQETPWGLSAQAGLHDYQFEQGVSEAWGLSLDLSLWPNFLGRSDRLTRNKFYYLARAQEQKSALEKLKFCQQNIFLYSSLHSIEKQFYLEKKRVKNSQDLLNWTQKSFKKFKIKKEALLSAQRNYLESKIALNDFEKKRNILGEQAKLLLGKNLNNTKDPLPAIDSLLIRTHEFRSSRRSESLKNEIRSAQSVLEESFVGSAPHVNLKGGYENEVNRGVFFGSDDVQQYTVGVHLNWKFFSNAQKSSTKIAKSELIQKKLELIQEERSLESEFSEKNLKIKHLRSSIKLQQQLVSLSIKQESLFRKRLKQGSVDFGDYNFQRDRLINSENRLADLKLEYIQKASDLMLLNRAMDEFCQLKEEGRGET